MIPLRLTLKNFLSYRQASLDFRGLHTACICGANGSGKSSLLEAMTWALWGQSRGVTEDDVIHLGEREARVEFIFESQDQVYRVIRGRQYKQATILEFQVAQHRPDSSDRLDPCRSNSPINLEHLNFFSLTEKGVRATQQKIVRSLKLDYETFINSAYLRQGQGDEFMLKRPHERKQVLADLLKLEQYDRLAEQARERSRDFKAQAHVLEQNLKQLEQHLQQRSAIAQEWTERQATVVALQDQEAGDRALLHQLQQQQQQRQTWQQTLTFQTQQHQRLCQEHDRLQGELQAAQHQHQNLAQVLAQADAIEQGHATWQQLQHQEEQWAERAKAYHTATSQRTQLQEALQQQRQSLQSHLEKVQVQLQQMEQQQQTLLPILRKKEDVATALVQLRQARDRLQQFDHLQSQVAPLSQRRHQLQLQLQQLKTRLSTRLEELHSTFEHHKAKQAQAPCLLQAFEQVNEQVGYLEQRKRYLEQLRDKGLERRRFLERLQAHQRDYETHLMELEHQAQTLSQPGVPCPLCARPLEGHHWQTARQQQEVDRQETLDMLWVVKDQLVVSDREIQVLREEYRRVEKELSTYGQVLERRGQLQQQLTASLEAQTHLQHLEVEIKHLETCLHQDVVEPELQQELGQIERTLGELAYDDRTHALVRGEAERWRWAEIKQAEIRNAERQQEQLAEQLPELQQQRQTLQQQLNALATSQSQQQIEALDRYLLELNYDLDRHQQLRQELQQAQTWQWRFQELHQARQTYSQVQHHITTLQQQIQDCAQERDALLAEISQLQENLVPSEDFTTDLPTQIQTLSQHLQTYRHQLDHHLAALGRLQQQRQQLEDLQQQYQQQQQQQQTCRYQQQIYQELAQAFGKNGIQALLIENLLPQLESETNHLLSRLSANQLHVQFITQRTRRNGASDKLIDTLDIRIADAKGTRPYETYSGGEAFRVNFAIRLALARLFARRSGTPLQLLIVDEGFGTQDAEGCDRLIAAINAIANDFACILTITHMPQFKEAFQTRIEVQKTSDGSKLSLAV